MLAPHFVTGGAPTAGDQLLPVLSQSGGFLAAIERAIAPWGRSQACPSVADRSGGVAEVASTQPIARFGIDHDGLGIAPPGLWLDLVTTTAEFDDRIRRETAPLDVEQVRQPLMMEARAVHCLLHVLVEVDHVRDHLQHGANDAR